MRILLAAGVVGALFGAVAAVAVTKLALPPVLPVVAERVPAANATEPLRVPSGWNLGFLSRLADVESRLGTIESSSQAEPTASASTPDGNDLERDAKRIAELDVQYSRDLEIQEQKLSAHAREPMDSPWARTQGEVIARTLESAIDAQRPMRVKRVECKSATCVAELVYGSPDDAMADRDVLTRKIVSSCRGVSSALTPPTGPGEYTTTVIYECR